VDVTDIQPTPALAIELKRKRAIDEAALRTIFLEARTANGFLEGPVSRQHLERAIEIALLGPTSANALPARFVVVESAEAKEKLKPSLAPGNLEKTMKAPATIIVAADLKFYLNFPRTFPTRPEMADRFSPAENAEMAKGFARDNAILQMGYLTIALRSLGLDVGPMGGFDKEKVDAAFFPDGAFISIYLMNVGYADDTKSFPRLPRLPVDEITKFV
jgi:3-hydroxypropanoate dehydrogenase